MHESRGDFYFSGWIIWTGTSPQHIYEKIKAMTAPSPACTLLIKCDQPSPKHTIFFFVSHIQNKYRISHTKKIYTYTHTHFMTGEFWKLRTGMQMLHHRYRNAQGDMNRKRRRRGRERGERERLRKNGEINEN